jgi:Dolichyl-phosphate-mannose-protein mannosyltransferase
LGLVALSTLLHWLAARRIAGLWIMPDEAIYAQRGLDLWHHFRLPILNGQGAGYSVLYPALAGLPLAASSLSDGYAWLKVVQALVISLGAIPIYVYCRQLMPSRYARLAAALTLASPLTLYAGFVMTEVLYYPLAAFALLAMARSVTTARVRDQLFALALVGAAIATRVQAVVLIGVFASAVGLEAFMARDRSRLRAFWPVWALLAAIGVTVAIAPGAFGAYAGTLGGGYHVGSSIRFVYYHLAYIVLLVAVLPIAALGLLATEAMLGRERDPWARALLAVSLSTVVLVALQVGLFAGRYAPHLLGRDLAAVPPTVFVAFSLWLARGAPRPYVLASLTIFSVAAVVLAAPWNDLIANNALPDTMGIAPFLSHAGERPAVVIAFGVAITLLLFLFAPRRFTLLIPAVVLFALIGSDFSADSLVAKKVRFDQAAMVGSPRDWIDRAIDAPVAYVYDGDSTDVNIVWQQRFWNDRIRSVLAIPPYAVTGPIESQQAVPEANGRLPLAERYVVANDDVTFVGAPVAQQDRGVDYPGLTLWRLSGLPRIATSRTGFLPNGDVLGHAQVVAWGCAGGQLQLTLIPKATNELSVALDGTPMLHARIGGLEYWNGAVSVPPTHQGPCVFTITGGELLGSTKVQFAPR